MLCGERERAASTLEQALSVARRQQAKSWELRAATTLARLLASSGESARAIEVLTPVYNWFTEGRDTKDLQEAAQLLDELGGTTKHKKRAQRVL
jgi:predicted ATPase